MIGNPRAWALCNCTAKPKPNRMENKVHIFDSNKMRVIEKASWSVGEFQAIESAPKPYMFTSSTPNNAKPRIISISTMREAAVTGPGSSRPNAESLSGDDTNVTAKQETREKRRAAGVDGP